jgi:hypothetical protein
MKDGMPVDETAPGNMRARKREGERWVERRATDPAL